LLLSIVDRTVVDGSNPRSKEGEAIGDGNSPKRDVTNDSKFKSLSKALLRAKKSHAD
jgi:hypothetical protein